MRSDLYDVSHGTLKKRVEAAAAPMPVIDLDPRFYSQVGDFDRRFPSGIPSLARCTSLKVQYDGKRLNMMQVLGTYD